MKLAKLVPQSFPQNQLLIRSISSNGALNKSLQKIKKKKISSRIFPVPKDKILPSILEKASSLAYKFLLKNVSKEPSKYEKINWRKFNMVLKIFVLLAKGKKQKLKGSLSNVMRVKGQDFEPFAKAS